MCALKLVKRSVSLNDFEIEFILPKFSEQNKVKRWNNAIINLNFINNISYMSKL